MGLLEDELDRQKEENRIQHEQILVLQGKIQDMELKLQKVKIKLNEIPLISLLILFI